MQNCTWPSLPLRNERIILQLCCNTLEPLQQVVEVTLGWPSCSDMFCPSPICCKGRSRRRTNQPEKPTELAFFLWAVRYKASIHNHSRGSLKLLTMLPMCFQANRLKLSQFMLSLWIPIQSELISWLHPRKLRMIFRFHVDFLGSINDIQWYQDAPIEEQQPGWNFLARQNVIC